MTARTAVDIFGREGALVGMIHVGALPGTPSHAASMDDLATTAVVEAGVYAAHGFDALLVENMGDVPYLQRDVGEEITAAMTAIACAVRDAVDRPLGIQVLAGANRSALAVAHAAGAAFIRAEGFVFASVADEGLLARADAGPLLRHRRMIGAENVAILVDIRKKHSSHAITADLDLRDEATAATFFGADGLVVTGRMTGDPVDPADLEVVAEATDLPLAIGSGVTPGTVPGLLASADALIVGSFCKQDGLWSNPVDPDRVRAIADARP